MLDAYDRGLKWVLRHQFFTLMVAVATLVATVCSTSWCPRACLPQQDTGLIIGVTDAAQSISFKAMVERQRQIAEIVRQDPDVASVASFVGAGTVNATVNTGRLYHRAQAARRAQRERRGDHRAPARARATSQGISLFMQAAQDVQIDSRVSRTQYQYTLQDADLTRAGGVGAEAAGKLRTSRTHGRGERSADERPASSAWTSIATRRPA